MSQIPDLYTINDNIFKAWIFSNGEELIFSHNKEHYSYINNIENGDYSSELIKGGIRILKYKNCFACNIHNISEYIIYKIILFMKQRSLLTESITIEIENNKETLQFNSFKDLNQYYNIKFN